MAARQAGRAQGAVHLLPVRQPGTATTRLLLGWAGWDHREQAYALIIVIEERSATDGWDADRLKPLLAGLSEVMPWVRQWHGEVDNHTGTSPAEAYDTYLTSQREKYGLTEEDLHNWKPPQPTRDRRAVMNHLNGSAEDGLYVPGTSARGQSYLIIGSPAARSIEPLVSHASSVSACVPLGPAA
jgi:hypothetical protein